MKDVYCEDFLDKLDGEDKNMIIKLYPKQYKDYLIGKESDKYNL